MLEQVAHKPERDCARQRAFNDCGPRRLLSGDRSSALEVRPASLEGLDEILSKRCDTLLIPLQFRRACQRDCGKNERRQQ